MNEKEELCSAHEEDKEARPEYKGQLIKCSWCKICREQETKKEDKILNKVEIYNKV